MVGCGYVGNLNKVGSGICGCVCVYVRQDVGIDSSDVFLALAKEITKKIEFSDAPLQFGIVIKWYSFNFVLFKGAKLLIFSSFYALRIF